MSKTEQISPAPDSEVTTDGRTATSQPGSGQATSVAAPALEPHPYSNLFPRLDDDAYQEFAADVRASGVREPITLFEGKILDGLNRYRAAGDAGIECPTKEYVGDDPLGFVISMNLKRRHLDEGQRAMVASKIADLEKGRRPIGKFAHVPTQREAAKLLNVSPRSVKSARVVREHGTPELIEAAEAGRVSVAAAAGAAQLPEAEQREAAAKGKKGIAAAAKKVRLEKQARKMPKQTDLMLTNLHHLAGHCKDIPAERFLAALQNDARRKDALGSMRIVNDWAGTALSIKPDGPSPSEKSVWFGL